MKVVLSHILRDDFVSELQKAFPQLHFVLALTPEEQAREAVDAEIIWGVVHRDAFLAAKQLKWFCYIGIGIDTMLKAVPELRDSDIPMTISRGTHVEAMADHVFAMMLAFAHRLPEAVEDQKQRRWDTMKYHRTIRELPGSTMGILAFGDIGRAVARRAVAFDMEIYAVDLFPGEAPEGVKAVWGPDRLDELMRISDWLVVTAPWTPQTCGMVGRDQLAQVKEGSHIIVVSRGGIVDEAALAEALQTGHLRGAALDALVEEPPPENHPLWSLPNTIITAHTSAESAENYDRRGEIFKENLHRYLAGEPLMYVVDKKRGF